MDLSVREVLARIITVPDMVRAFRDEHHCRRLLEAMVWPGGRICPACGYRRSIALTSRESGKRARPGLYQCSSGTCRFQFTVTTRTPLHATKLPLRTWLSGLWLMLQSDKGISSIRLAEALGVSQPTAWRMGHALRLMVGREHALDGVVEIDSLYVGGKPRRDPNYSPPGRGRKGEPKTLKTPALVAVQRPPDVSVGARSGEVRAAVIEDLSQSEADRVLTEAVEPSAHLMSDEWKAFVSLGSAFAAHDTVHHKAREYARGSVHINSAEGFNDRIRRTVSGVFHHISPHLADLYFNEIGFRWAQRVVTGQAPRRTRKGRQVTKTLWARVPPALQLPAVFRSAVGREMRRTKAGGIDLLSKVAVFG
ncbi:IS1595 family transposase [Microvirga sp. VF16]|uniref:IS1595 family transposase n=1 Tax=Microvirga sp. VF16 TaxID=2807101 RepID=UPI00193E88BE|nr:IS1595 family transposase [Microvirga sp. VF16]QRM35973.1 IS1595 family transposase [Microvirga sp. VF16]